MNQKRNPNDEAAAARRMSQSDQHAKPGIIGSMWNNFTKGHSGSASPPKAADTMPQPAKQSIHRTGAGTLG